MPAESRQRRAARHVQPHADSAPTAPRKTPITVDRITDAALQVIATEGYDALTIRRVAAVLDTGPSSLYAHILNKDDLDDLLIGRLCAEIELPEPDPAPGEVIVGVRAFSINAGEVILIEQRPDGSYAIHGTKIFIRTNKDAPQYRVVQFDLSTKSFQEFIREDKHALLDYIDPVAGQKFVVIYKRVVRFSSSLFSLVA